ncbi:MAG: hypothetical protein VR64_12110 [Desulfatitalea sp. BRH_c12]|nr:MAG: hypothetical protein VR64_12110 [Desulfatitalea sp. BRH_c12]
MLEKNPFLWIIASAFVGAFVIHPFIMILAEVMVPVAHGADTDPKFWESIQMAFSFSMLPWTFGFATMGGFTGWILFRMQSALTEEKKLQGAMELAGAACHELNQPMQVILNCAEIMSSQLREQDDLRLYADEMISQILRMDKILKKTTRITKYRTVKYVKGRIIDIDKASDSDLMI